MDQIVQKAHFLRRAGFGATLDELQGNTAPEEWLTNWLKESPPLNVPAPEPIERGQEGKQTQALGAWLLKQLVTARNPLHERIVNFWRDRFVVALRKS